MCTMEIHPAFLAVLFCLTPLLFACGSPDAQPGRDAPHERGVQSGSEASHERGMQPGRDTSTLKQQIHRITEAAEGDYAVAFIDAGNPETSLFIDADEWFHAASTMKTPVMIEVYRQAMEGKFDLDDKLVVRNEFVSIADGSTYSLSIDRDSGDALYDHLGSELSIRELVYSMIVRSGNLATNIVIEHVGAENVNRAMADMGAEGIRVLRGVEDMAAFRAGMNNEVTARGLAMMYLRLAEGSALDKEYRSQVLSVLKDQHFRDMIPALLPEEVTVAHKTGWITGVRHDSGIVYLPDGRAYVLVILSKNVPDRADANRTGAEISRKIYDFMTEKPSQGHLEGKKNTEGHLEGEKPAEARQKMEKPLAGDPLEDRVVVVDPGHGGTAAFDDYRVGPAGEREEWINLRVALKLRDLLEERGARVLLTRTEDVEVDLSDRARLAVENEADAFVSVHHNATADPEVNFPIVYFHGNASENGASVMLAKAMADRMNLYLFDGKAPVSVVSDHTIFPTAGTGVLRNSYGIPGVIVEASFFTNPEEEQRLRDPEYNRLEAEAHVMALEDFFYQRHTEILEKYSTVQLPPFEVFQEAGRMADEARLWKQDYREGKRLMEYDADLEKALELLTRSVRSFPDSWVAGSAHAARADILERLGRKEEAETIRLRVAEFYVVP